VIAARDQELALRAEEIRRRDTALEREQQLAAMFADRLRALEAPASSSEVREDPLRRSRRRRTGQDLTPLREALRRERSTRRRSSRSGRATCKG
jgi:hypothetical protein